MTSTQVDKTHYAFDKYVTFSRWATVWYQLRETCADKPKHVLEIGPGPGLFAATLRSLGTQVDTIDIDPKLRPTIAASVTSLPLKDQSYDTVCAFQILEHLPYETSLIAFYEITRIAKKKVIISVPDSKKGWPYSIKLPLVGELKGYISRFWHRPKTHIFDGQHYWEVNTKDYPIERVIADLDNLTNWKLQNHFKCPESPKHLFFIFART